MTVTHTIGYFFVSLAVVGIAYQLIALAAVLRFFAKPAQRGNGSEPVSVLKPLHGAEPRLVDNLSSFIEQDYTGPVQVVFGVSSPDDGALAAVADVRDKYPHADIAISTGPRGKAANAKIGNFLAMLPLASHDVLVLSDSDMAVNRDYLAKLLGALEQSGIGAVTCLYAGRGDSGFWSRISAAAMSYTGLPNMVMALSTSIAQPCLGSTIAIRSETLARIGGFERFADVLADDYAIGEAVAALGLKVAVPPMVLTHACAHRNLAELWHQHLRWSATIRGVAPLRHAGSGVTHALIFALLACLFFPLCGVILAAVALTTRVLVALTVDRIAGVQSRFIHLLPLADLLEFTAFVASFGARAIDWRGSQLTMTQKGRIAPRNSSTSELS
jgi:ceramide glucosyltransferase